jgi:hypothetical protein
MRNVLRFWKRAGKCPEAVWGVPNLIAAGALGGNAAGPSKPHGIGPKNGPIGQRGALPVLRGEGDTLDLGDGRHR